MGVWAFTFLFVLALSMDSFGIGCVLGMKKISLSYRGIITIALFSSSGFLISSYLGTLLLPVLSPEFAEKLGAFLLIGIGLYFLYQCFHKPVQDTERMSQPGRVLKDPSLADMDQSGGIKGKEVWLLGAALSLDTLAAGFSGAFIGIALVKTAVCIFIVTCLMLYGGLVSGAKLSENVENISVIPACLLIIIGIFKLT